MRDKLTSTKNHINQHRAKYALGVGIAVGITTTILVNKTIRHGEVDLAVKTDDLRRLIDMKSGAIRFVGENFDFLLVNNPEK